MRGLYLVPTRLRTTNQLSHVYRDRVFVCSLYNFPWSMKCP